MGHSRIGTLPATRPWKEVVSLIAAGADSARISAKTADAAKDALHRAARDPALKRAVWLLARIPLAAREADFPAALRKLGLDVGDEPDLFEICGAVTAHIDGLLRTTGRQGDFAEIAQTALVESLTAIVQPKLPALGLTVHHEDFKLAIGSLATVKQFGLLARDFFARLIRRSLDYYLSRELPNHVGEGKRFHSLNDHRAFLEALDRHCHETAVIVQEFAGSWHSKTEYEIGINEVKAGSFAWKAFDKITLELGVRSGEELARAA